MKCDYCGATVDLEKYEPKSALDDGWRCKDAIACDKCWCAQNVGDTMGES